MNNISHHWLFLYSLNMLMVCIWGGVKLTTQKLGYSMFVLRVQF